MLSIEELKSRKIAVMMFGVNKIILAWPL